MRIVFWSLALLIIALILGLGEVALLRFFNKDWWQHKIVKRISIGLVIWGIISVIIWVIGFISKIMWISNLGAISTVFMLTLSLSLIFSLPFSGFFNWLNRKLEERRKKKQISPEEKFDKYRRLMLKSVAIAFPVASVIETGTGLTLAFSDTNIFVLPLEFKNLPRELDGLRILHLSDAHLGIYKDLDDLEKLIERADEFKPDITLFTGDICDKLPIYNDALRIVAQSKSKYGAYASLGNHEYYRGINSVLRAFDQSDVPLLINSGVEIKVGNSSLYISGADDPKVMGRDLSEFHRQSVIKALDGAPSEAFHILMSHRPEAFDAATENNIDLTFAGHTHGGQLGFNRKSFLIMFMPDNYIWGHYKNNGAQLYVSCGIGHWFPFRLGCPSEAPIIELKSKL